MRRYLLFLLLFGLSIAMWGDDVPSIDLTGLPQPTTAKSLRYWFDTDANSVKTTTTLSGATTIDASSLMEGVHIVHYQIVDSKNIAGIPASKMFVRIDERIAATSKSLRYWFDTDANSVKTTTTLSGATTIDASALTEGVHIVHYQIVDSKDMAGIPASKMFIKVDGKTVTKANSLRYWFDNDMTSVKTTALPSEAVTIDASALVEGIHMLHYQIVDDKGVLGCVVTKMFFKVSAKTVSTATAIRYWFDEDTEVQQVDVAEIVQVSTNKLKTNGSHELRFQLVDNQGKVSPVRSASFDYAIPGDANQDGLVNVTDIVATVNYIMENPTGTFDKVAADVNKDGFINVSDIVAMVNIIMTSGSRMDQQEVMAILRRCGFIFKREEIQY